MSCVGPGRPVAAFRYLRYLCLGAEETTRFPATSAYSASRSVVSHSMLQLLTAAWGHDSPWPPTVASDSTSSDSGPRSLAMRQFDAFLPLTTQHDEWQHEVVDLGFGRVEERRGGGRHGGRGCRRLSPDAGASVHAVAPFPLPAHRTQRADLRHYALRPASLQARGGLRSR